jgi:carbon monoxide dehydrogenase subunit G
VLIEGRFPVGIPPQSLMPHLLDARLMASCVPGCESVEAVGDDGYRTVVVIAMAGIKARFDLLVQITRRDDLNVWTSTRGDEGGQASRLQADSHLSLAPAADGSMVTYRSEV